MEQRRGEGGGREGGRSLGGGVSEVEAWEERDPKRGKDRTTRNGGSKTEEQSKRRV